MRQLLFTLFVSRALLGISASSFGDNVTGEVVNLEVKPIIFLPTLPEAKVFGEQGELKYCGGLQLSSGNSAFGGLSGVILLHNGSRLLAVEDVGRWFSATLHYTKDGHLNNLSDALLGPLLDAEGDSLIGKELGDAESIIASGHTDDLDFLISFERRHRIWRYHLEGGGSGPMHALAQPVANVTDYILQAGCEENGGMEAIALLADGGLLVFCEKPPPSTDAIHVVPGWVFDVQQGEAPQKLFLDCKEDGWYPTDLATLPGGDVLVLQRFYSRAKGSAMRLRRLKQEDICDGVTLEGKLIAEFSAADGFAIDNMEGAAVFVHDTWGTRLLIVSDDNFSPSQQTVLHMFQLSESHRNRSEDTWAAPPSSEQEAHDETRDNRFILLCTIYTLTTMSATCIAVLTLRKWYSWRKEDWYRQMEPSIQLRGTSGDEDMAADLPAQPYADM
ncbi:hypothetical protein CYMTET_29587 [Cymbomonas tetramitiformis]|uniref:Phytase-like domain-containing protein n=1 Tax=Cymbomonas tetramitiformis TaxID=36881 RepID=A0AAE0FKR5_9CHLO|nr:hypothetical protein CYMTET_29587 [Cymbomonas tetramitiformis]